MSSICVLNKEISELIAAGEVIERPASVIKELVENAVDSGAKHITVEIKNGGVTYMRVSDDGCGMSFEDVPTAFLRHATSKITTKDDLDNINTLGFRGEALASVSAVARVELMTKREEDDYGTLYEIEGSEEISHEKGGCPDGTTIVVRDLFYNVPARRKFMKKDVTEANAVSQIMQKITLSHPDISFKLIRDNRMEFNSSGDGELFSAVHAVYGRDFARDLIPVEHEYKRVKVKGYAIKPLYSKSNRSFQNFFVNGRYVRSRLCSAALENAYENLIMTGKFPACILMIELSPAEMDVNIHPSKAEVRFTNEKDVSDAVFFAIKNALVGDGLIYEFQLKKKTDWTKPIPEEDKSVQQEFMLTPVGEIEKKEQELGLSAPKTENTEKEKISDFSGVHKIKLPEPCRVKPAEEKNDGQEENRTEEVSAAVEGYKYIETKSFVQPPANVRKTEEEPKKHDVSEEFPDIKFVGEAFGLYIICESGNKMIIIDKHAAHERIIFERLRSRNCRQYSQQLLTGVKILLTADEVNALENNTELLADLGFSFDFSEKPCVTATAVPTFMMELDMEQIISEVAEKLIIYSRDPQSSELDDILHTAACKAAIKAGDKNTPEEMLALAKQVCYDEKIRHCPHGRPVMFTMTKYNIDHQFKRT